MSLLNIVKNVMDANGWQQPVTAVSSSNDQNMRQSMALANKALKNVSYMKNWPTLIRECVFTTAVGQDAYPIPPDFHHLVAPSGFNATRYAEMKGSLTPIQWYRKIANGYLGWGGAFWLDSFRIDAVGKQFLIAPLPSTPCEIWCMYVTSNIATDINGVPINQYSQDTDTSVIDEDLVELDLQWRWRQKKGLDYTAELSELGSDVKTRFAQYLGYGELDIGGRAYYTPLTQPNTFPWYPQPGS
jgi:hypothetical protein